MATTTSTSMSVKADREHRTFWQSCVVCRMAAVPPLMKKRCAQALFGFRTESWMILMLPTHETSLLPLPVLINRRNQK
jgi:hypothetical protein